MQLRQLIKTDPDYTIAALLHLFGGDKVFKCTERKILKILARQYESTGLLSDPQLQAAARILPKYHDKLAGLEVIASPEKKELPSQYDKIAWLDGISIRLKTNDRADAIRTKQLFNRRYRASDDSYSCQFTLDNLLHLKEWGFSFHRDLRRKQRKVCRKASTLTNRIETPGLPGTLREYQNEGVNFIHAKGGRALLGDDMGLGKTVQALAYCHLIKETPILIVTTGGSKLNWRNEVNIWLPGRSIFICKGRKPGIKKIKEQVTIINYDILKAWEPVLLATDFKVLIGDEIHYIKNPKANRSKAFKSLGTSIEKFIAMSGTPFDNRPIELFAAVNLLSPWLFPSYWDYAKRYCGAYEGDWGWVVTGASHIPELYEKLQYIMIRRNKVDVLKELPDKIRSIIPIEYDEKIYAAGMKEFKAWADRDWKRDDEGRMQTFEYNPAAAMVQIEKLKFACAKSKMPAVYEWIEEFLETDDKLVVFCEHQEIQQMLLEQFKKIAVHSKVKTSVYEFQKCDACGVVQDKHKSDPTACEQYTPNLKARLFIGGKDAIEAITLTAARATCTVEFWWTWTKHAQAEDRVYRIGQEHDSVNAFYLIADGTIENDIIKLLDKKRKVFDGALDGIETEKDDLLAGLLKKLV